MSSLHLYIKSIRFVRYIIHILRILSSLVHRLISSEHSLCGHYYNPGRQCARGSTSRCPPATCIPMYAFTGTSGRQSSQYGSRRWGLWFAAAAAHMNDVVEYASTLDYSPLLDHRMDAVQVTVTAGDRQLHARSTQLPH